LRKWFAAVLNDILKAVRDILKNLSNLAHLSERLAAIEQKLDFIVGQLALITGDPGDAESPAALTELVDRIESFADRYKTQAARIKAIGEIH
jgi:hypothetical protein